MAEEVPRQIANAHTIFNVANTVVFIFFTGMFARIVEKLVPERVEVSREIIAPKFLDESLIETPLLAMQAARFEGHRLSELASKMVHDVGPAIQSRDPKQLDELEKLDDQVDVLKQKIMDYLGEIYRQELTTDESKRLLRMMRAADEIQRISARVRNDLIPVGRTLIESDLEVSETTKHAMEALYDSVCKSVRLAVEAIDEKDEAKALEVIQLKSTVKGLISDALDFQQERIAPTDPDLVMRFRLEDEVIDAMKHIYTLSKRLANLLLPEIVAARDV